MCVFTLPKASIDLVLIGVSTHMHQLELAHIGSSRAVTLPSVVYPNKARRCTYVAFRWGYSPGIKP